METETFEQGLATDMNRRRVIKTGAKLAYAVPLVAASFSLASRGASALSPVCEAGTCTDPSRCGTFCACVSDDAGTTFCGEQARCSTAPLCSAGCPDDWVCATQNCCLDQQPRCVPPCGTFIPQPSTFSRVSLSVEDEDWVLGPNVQLRPQTETENEKS